MRFAVLFVVGMLSACQIWAASGSFQAMRLFEGDAGGYKLYRIPGVVVTTKGTILAYTEARRTGSGDWDSIDILLRRSTDGGRTFSPQRVIAQAPGKIDRNPVAVERNQRRSDGLTYNNPVAIADRNGTVHFLFCVEYMRAFYMRSDDDGQTFSVPTEITSAFDDFRSEYAWRVLATGPGHGIQLRSGRLLVPVWLSLGTAGNGHHPSVTATIFSDDDGATWHRGDIAVPNTPEFPDPNETAAVELADGTVMLNVRTDARENRRTDVVSKDGATHWSPPRFQEHLPDPICFASIVRLSTAEHGGRNRLLFVNPDNLARADGKDARSKDRVNLAVRLSYDEGAHWTVKRTIEPGKTGYADLAVMPDGTILCLYEVVKPTPEGSERHDEMLGRFNLEWLTEGADSLPAHGLKRATNARKHSSSDIR
ncbi:MAG TPA: sialidase family protein [Bryobacteraceae bacterium]|nr:sialidase family protein [Bryobacteraceae bacterium]